MQALLVLRRCAAASLAIGFSCAATLHAASAPPAYQSMLDALTKAHQAVVAVQVVAAEGARSAETLGRQRRGSGVVIGPDGLILTIGYLMLEADAIQVVTHDDRVLPARAVGYDLATGFGLIRPLLPMRGIPAVQLGSTAQVQAGEPLMAAIGGEGGEVAATQLVSKRAFSGYWEYHIEGALFASPPIQNHSGAPLFNQRGELLGIGSLFVGNALGDQRRMPGNMYVPVDLLKPILTELQETGTTRKSRRPWLGLSSAEQGGRLQIVRVSPESPAQAAGLSAGDYVLAIDGEDVATLEAFYKKLWSHGSPDAEIRLTVQQGSETRQLILKAVDRMSTIRRPAGI